ncbi:MAG: hypothetical protein K5768_02680 [Firmicutes bacterium]|nr:hypothetical protein [Bacillota bacterium]
MKRILSSMIAIAVIAAILPTAAVFAAPQTYDTGNIFSSDFSTLPEDKATATAKAEGGWDLNDNAGLANSTNGGGTVFCPSDAPNKATSTSTKSSVYYFQPEQIACTGIYHVNYDVYAGTNVSVANVYFHKKQDTSGQGQAVYNSHSVGKLIDNRNSAGIARINKGEWYNIDMIIDLDLRTYGYTIFNSDGSVKWAMNGTYNAAYFGGMDFQVAASSAIAAGDNTSMTTENCMLIDNLSIRHYDGSLIYSNDFETQEQNPKYLKAQWYAGGLTQELTSAFVSGGYNGSSYAYGFVNADGKSLDPNYRDAALHIPALYRHNFGIYKVTFCLKPGDYTSYFAFPFNDTDQWNSGTNLSTGNINVGGTTSFNGSSGTIARGQWYRVELTVNAEEDNFDLSVYDLADTAHPLVWHNSGATTKNFSYVALAERTTYNGTMPAGGGPRIDNLEVHYYKYGRTMGENFDSKEIYNKKQTGDTMLGSGKWDLSGRANFVPGGVNGSSYAFCPAYKNSSGTGNGGSSEYYLPADEVSSMGQYRLGFWFRCGQNQLRLFISSQDSFNRDNTTYAQLIADVNSGLTQGQWYHADLVVDLDLKRYNFRICDTEGVIKSSYGGGLNSGIDRMTCFSWQSYGNQEASPSVYSLIDDVYITHNSASVDEKRVNATQGIKFENDKVTYMAKVFNNLFISGDSQTKHYRAFLGVYDGNELVYFDQSSEKNGVPNDYFSANNSVSYSNLPNGTGSGYTYRMFVWNTGSNSTENKAFSKMVEKVKP